MPEHLGYTGVSESRVVAPAADARAEEDSRSPSAVTVLGRVAA